MSIDSLQGVTYGPFAYRTDPEKVAEYAATVGARPPQAEAPRSLMGALLFVVAPHLLGDERAAGATRSVIHGDQTFEWIRPIPMGAELSVTGTVARVRERAGVFFTGFDLEVMSEGLRVAVGSSTFLMSGGDEPPAGGSAERREPPPLEGTRRVVEGTLAEDSSVLGSFAASRADLVRYAGAARDWNPIHWDHEAAVVAGLPGVVVHGLLQSGWVVEAAVELGLEPTSARFRYRRPLGAGVTVDLVGARRGAGAGFELRDVDGPYLAATIEA
jgi:acyl dehydratase